MVIGGLVTSTALTLPASRFGMARKVIGGLALAIKEKSIVLKIKGMDCAEEVAILKREIGPLVGGEGNLSFDVLKGQMTVLSSAPGAKLESIVKAVQKTGMDAAPNETNRADRPEKATWWERRGRLTLTLASGALTAAALGLHLSLTGNWADVLGSEGMGEARSIPFVVRALYSLAVLAGVFLVLPKAWFSLRRLRPDMNLLMTIAVCGAVAIGEWFEAATVSFLFALSLSPHGANPGLDPLAERFAGEPQIKRSMGTRKNSASRFACALLIDRRALNTSVAAPLLPSTGQMSLCFSPRSSISAFNDSLGETRGSGWYFSS